MEAKVLDAHLIEEHKPHCNIVLKDDKKTLFFKVTNELYLRLILVRKSGRRGGFPAYAGAVYRMVR